MIETFGIHLRCARPIHVMLVVSLALWASLLATSAQSDTNDDIQNGHELAVTICTICHLVAPDQAAQPTGKPPAPSFESIAQRKDTTAESASRFLVLKSSCQTAKSPGKWRGFCAIRVPTETNFAVTFLKTRGYSPGPLRKIPVLRRRVPETGSIFPCRPEGVQFSLSLSRPSP